MKDGPIRKAIKRGALLCFIANLKGTRALWRARGDRPYRLGGTCQHCAACCETPGIQVGRLVWYLPTVRWLFLQYHRHVNGFVLKERVPEYRLFVFRCTHFDWETRRCDSYDSRPGMCRDYPRAQLWQSRPEFLPGCGYRAIDPKGSRLIEALEAEGLEAERLEQVKKKLNLE